MYQNDSPPFDKSIFKSLDQDTKITVEIPENINLNKQEQIENRTGIFLVRTANDCIEDAENRPIPKLLFDKLWYEGELCILFADTNLGKSILAVQIGNSISKEKSIQGFQLEATKSKVLYFDFELSDKQFEARYSINFKNHYQFDTFFLRAEIDPEQADPKEAGFNNFDEYLNHSLEEANIRLASLLLTISLT